MVGRAAISKQLATLAQDIERIDLNVEHGKFISWQGYYDLAQRPQSMGPASSPATH